MRVLIIIVIGCVLSSLLPVIAGLKAKKGDKSFIIFFLYTIVACITDLTMLWLALHSIRNLFIAHFYISVEFTLLFLFLTTFTNEKYLKIFYAVYVFGITIILYDSFVLTPFSLVPELAKITESGLLIALGFISWIDNKDEKEFFGRIIIVIGMIAYFIVNVITSSYINHNVPLMWQPIFSLVANIIYYIGVKNYARG